MGEHRTVTDPELRSAKRQRFAVVKSLKVPDARTFKTRLQTERKRLAALAGRAALLTIETLKRAKG